MYKDKINYVKIIKKPVEECDKGNLNICGIFFYSCNLFVAVDSRLMTTLLEIKWCRCGV